MKFYAGIGSRETPPRVCGEMAVRAMKLAPKGYTLRSGAAYGADRAFEAGALVEGGKAEIWLPWLGYNGHCSSLVPSPAAFELAAKFHPNFWNCSRGARALHARNSHIILGADLNTPVEFVLYWTPDGKASGGTGQGLRIAQHYGIPCHLVTMPKS